MKALRITLIVLLIVYGAGSLFGAVLSLFSQARLAEAQQLGELTPGLEKSMLLSGAVMVGQVWLYFSAIALLLRNMKEGYMYAVTLGFIELIQAIVIIIALATHGFGKPTDYSALVKGLLLLIVALIAFKKSQTTIT